MSSEYQNSRIRGTTPGGTDLRATFSKRLKWIPTSGIITPVKWGNLPGGSPFSPDGSEVLAMRSGQLVALRTDGSGDRVVSSEQPRLSFRPRVPRLSQYRHEPVLK